MVEPPIATDIRLQARHGPLFDGLPDAVAEEMLRSAQAQCIDSDVALFRQGDAPDYLLLVVGGLVRMTRQNGGGAQTTLRLMGPGELLGCAAVVRGFPYPATATTLETSHFLSWPAPEFLDLMHRHRELADILLKIIGDRTREMVERAASSPGKTLEERVAGALLELARQAGVASNGQIQIKVSTVREDLAALSGVGYFTISRILSDWQKQGFVRSGRQRITIVDEQRIKRIVEPETYAN